MAGLSAAPVIGNAPIQPGHTSAQFGAFVVQRTSPGATLPLAVLTASPSTIAAGGSSTLSWTTSGASSVSIDQGVGSVAASGSRLIAPGATTTYTLTATSTGGSTTSTAVVTVGPAAPTTSADGTLLPPAAQVVDAQGAVWTLNGTVILRNGASAAGGTATKILWTGGSIYVLGTDANWWQWVGSSWSNVGRTQPGGGSPPPSPPPPTGGPSADGTVLPPAAQVVDAQGAVWTLNGTVILRNGASAAGGTATKILWSGGSVYVLGMDANWWKWLGSSWSNVGTDPAGWWVAATLTPAAHRRSVGRRHGVAAGDPGDRCPGRGVDAQRHRDSS